MTILAVDAGNTRVKWGVHDGVWIKQGWVEKENIFSLDEAWREIATPRRIVISNVAGSEAADALKSLCSRWQVSPDWITPAACQCGVRNGYANPAQLGADRWAALIAAWHLQRAACLVVNLGTAMTVDALSGDGRFLGGIIVPGVTLMQQALASNTSALKIQPGSYERFPDNTADAIYTGAIQALSGAVERMGSALASSGSASPTCVVSGGAAQLLLPHLTLPWKVVDNLVLEGLVLIAKGTC